MPPMPRAPALRTCLTDLSLTLSLIVGVGATAAAGVACSAVSKVDYASCEASTDCRGAFGLAWVCGAAGLCEEVPLDPRCVTYPTKLFTDPEYADAIVLGSLFDHNKSDGDLKLVNSASLAIEEANASQLEGRKFGIVHCDYHSDPAIDDLTAEDAALAGARYLVDQLGAAAIIGPGTSDLAQVVLAELQKPDHAQPTLIVSPSATSPSLTDADPRDGSDPGLFWRTAPPDSLLSKVLADKMTAAEVASAIVIYDGGAYGSGIALALDKNFDPDPELIAYEDPKKIVSIVDQVSKRTPGDDVAVVFIASDVQEVIDFLNAASAYPEFYANVQLFLGDAAYNDAVLMKTQGASALYPKIRGVFPGGPSGSVYKFFVASYKALWDGEDPEDASYSSYTYDATWLALYGAAWAQYKRDGELDNGLNYAFGLQQVSDPGGLKIEINGGNWNTVKREFKAGRAINVVGASGELDYDPATEETTAPVIFWKIKDTNDGFEDAE